MLILRKARSVLKQARAWRFTNSFVLAALLAIPFGLYFFAANFSRFATDGLLGLFGLIMFFVLLEG